MKKTQPALRQEPHRLRLNRETIRVLDPALLGLAKGGGTNDTTATTTQESTSGGVANLLATDP